MGRIRARIADEQTEEKACAPRAPQRDWIRELARTEASRGCGGRLNCDSLKLEILELLAAAELKNS